MWIFRGIDNSYRLSKIEDKLDEILNGKAIEYLLEHKNRIEKEETERFNFTKRYFTGFYDRNNKPIFFHQHIYILISIIDKNPIIVKNNKNLNDIPTSVKFIEKTTYNAYCLRKPSKDIYLFDGENEIGKLAEYNKYCIAGDLIYDEIKDLNLM